MKSNVFLVTRKVFLNLASLYVAQTTSHHPEFLDKRRQLRKRTLLSSTDRNNKHSSKQTLARGLFLIITSVIIRCRSCLLLCLSLDILASNNSFVNLPMFTCTWGHWSKTPKSQPEPVGLNLSSKSEGTLCRLINEFNGN